MPGWYASARKKCRSYQPVEEALRGETRAVLPELLLVEIKEETAGDSERVTAIAEEARTEVSLRRSRSAPATRRHRPRFVGPTFFNGLLFLHSRRAAVPRVSRLQGLQGVVVGLISMG